jgi:hypothetical protein
MGLQYMLYGVADLLGIQIHALSIQPNQWGMTLTDTRGVLPRLFEIVHGAAALWLKKITGLKTRHVWSLSEGLQRRILTTDEHVLEHTARILAAPVHIGLVEKGSQYCGVQTRPRDLGKPIKLADPGSLSLPTKAEIPTKFVARTTCPPQFSSLAEFRSRLIPVLAQSEQRARLASAGRPFAGNKKIRALIPTKPLTQLACVTKDRAYATDSYLMGKDRERHRAQCRRLRIWYLKRYKPAWNRYRDGKRDTLFPPNTYWRFFIEHLLIERAPPDAHLFV